MTVIELQQGKGIGHGNSPFRRARHGQHKARIYPQTD